MSKAPNDSALEHRSFDLGLFLAFFFLALCYAFVTEHVWEDYFITYKHSKNAALGIGLQYEASERIHGFTSPLGTLLPAAIARLVGTGSDYLVLWIFRLCCAIAFGAAAVLCNHILLALAVRTSFRLAALSLLAFDIKSVDFSMNGMETAFLLFFIALSLRLMLPLPRNAVWLGIAWAGLLWTRPDGCIYIAALAAAQILSVQRHELRKLLMTYLRAAIVCAAAYVPWFLWAWWYYGSPIPHTILAKGGAHGLQLQLMKVLNLPFKFLPGIPELDFFGRGPAENIHLFLFAPSYLFTRATATFSLALFSLVACFAIFFRARTELERGRKAIAYAALFIALYLYLIPSNYPWYIPGCALLFLLSLPFAFEALAKRYSPRRLQLVFGTAVLIQCGVFLLGTYYNHVRQIEIEEHHRKQIGLWLKEQAASGSTVFLECLGYIGYFSELNMQDYPGLVAPEVVKVRKEVGPYMGDVIRTLWPDYLVLRPNESLRIQQRYPGLLQERYRLVRTFDAKERLSRYAFLPWRHNLLPDAAFGIFQRVDTPAP